MSHSDIKLQDMSKRGLIIGSIMMAACSVLLLRVWGLQVFSGKKYKRLSEQNRFSFQMIMPKRGLILDRQGAVLAGNRKAFRLAIIPERVDNLPKVLNKLANLVGVSPRQLAQVKNKVKRQPRFVPATVKDFLSPTEVAKVQVNLPVLPGVLVNENIVRLYPIAEAGSHILGYTAPPTKYQLLQATDPLFRLPDLRVGRRGLEETFDDILRGKAGTRQVEVNVIGREVREAQKTPATDGQTLKLSLSKELQEGLFKKLAKYRGSAVLIDIKTGEILAAPSHPSYDPNNFVEGFSHADWQALRQSPARPLINRAFQGVYAPGSTFKMLVALAALEEGLVKAGERMTCEGHMEFGGRRFHCWKKEGHGRVDLIESIAQSCDIYFYELGRRLGVDTIAKYAHKYGLGHSLNTEVSDAGGLVPTRAWKYRRQGVSWVGGEDLITAIGQGYLQATPLQLAVMTARIASGLKVSPTLVKTAAEQVFEPMTSNTEYLNIIRQSMYNVANIYRGTASSLRKYKTKMAGKTGTSQVISKRHEDDVELESIPMHQRTNALFVGYAPFDNPRIAMSIVLENAGSGGAVAAPIAGEIMDEALAWLDKNEGQK